MPVHSEDYYLSSTLLFSENHQSYALPLLSSGPLPFHPNAPAIMRGGIHSPYNHALWPCSVGSSDSRPGMRHRCYFYDTLHCPCWCPLPLLGGAYTPCHQDSARLSVLPRPSHHWHLHFKLIPLLISQAMAPNYRLCPPASTAEGSDMHEYIGADGPTLCCGRSPKFRSSVTGSLSCPATARGLTQLSASLKDLLWLHWPFAPPASYQWC